MPWKIRVFVTTPTSVFTYLWSYKFKFTWLCGLCESKVLKGTQTRVNVSRLSPFFCTGFLVIRIFQNTALVKYCRSVVLHLAFLRETWCLSTGCCAASTFDMMKSEDFEVCFLERSYIYHWYKKGIGLQVTFYILQVRCLEVEFSLLCNALKEIASLLHILPLPWLLGWKSWCKGFEMSYK